MLGTVKEAVFAAQLFVGTSIADIGRLFKAMSGCRTVARTLGSAINNLTAAAVHSAFTVSANMLLFAFADKIAVFSEKIVAGHTYISCHFGEVDVFGNAGHLGTGILAPDGTHILAAHSGTVLVSGRNDSYGNQVLLDNGEGSSTRYAHMTQTAVTAVEAVTAGQGIGYVGNTGDSTGNHTDNHLHFEVLQGGVQVDPLSLVS